MEHTERITRRQLLGLSAVAAGSLLIPSIAYGSAESEDSPSPQKNGQSVMQLYWTKMAI